jgi:prophage tail gpP-like protein
MRSEDVIEVLIGGQVHSGWQRYEIDSDLLTPADAWHVTVMQADLAVPKVLVPGADVKVRVGGETVLQGVLDEWQHRVDRDGHELQLGGRDGAGVLIDCSAPITSTQQLTLDQVVARIVRPLGITRIRIDAEKKLTREKVSTEPGDTAWDALRRAAEANGLWPWFEPDGTLVVGGPRYDTEPVEQLIMRRDGQGNNLLNLAERRAMHDRHSEITVLGQAHAVGNRDGRPNVKATVRDTGVKTYRPRVVVDHEAVNESIATARGKKLASDERVKSYELRAEVKGHRTSRGVLWTPGQRVTVRSEPHGIDGVYFLMSRRFSGDKSRGQRTVLSLREDGVWTLYAHPSKRRHRRGKNSLPGVVVGPGEGAPQ